MRWPGAVEDWGERLVDWRGKVSVGALLRETLRRASRQPTRVLAVPALIAGGMGGGLVVATDPHVSLPILALGSALLVGWWGRIAQDVAGASKPGRLLVLLGLALGVTFGGATLGARFDLGGWPLALAALLLAPLPMAIPAAAVDGLGPGVMVRDSWNASRGSLLRSWVACGVVGAALLVVQTALALVLLRHRADGLFVVGTLCAVTGAGLGLAMTLWSIGYLRLRNLRRCSDVSAWVEVFR